MSSILDGLKKFGEAIYDSLTEYNITYIAFCICMILVLTNWAGFISGTTTPVTYYDTFTTPNIVVEREYKKPIYLGSYMNVSQKKLTGDQRECMYLNVYHEAKNQTRDGMKAVIFVTLNRMMSNKYPNSICEVVKQTWRDSAGNIRLHKCQFSWFCDSRSDVPRDMKSWKRVQGVVNATLDNYITQKDITDGSLWYHAHYVNPYWADRLTFYAQIDDHLFYKEKKK